MGTKDPWSWLARCGRGTALSPMLRERLWTGRPQTPMLDEASFVPWRVYKRGAFRYNQDMSETDARHHRRRG